MVMLHIHQIPFSCFFSHTFCICSLSCSCVLLPWFPSVSLSQVRRWQTPPTVLLMMTSRNEQRKPRTYCLLLKHDARDSRRKMNINWSRDVMWKKCLAFITTPLTIDYGLMLKLKLHQINRMKNKIFPQPVNVFIYKQTKDLINAFDISSVAILIV